MSTPAAQLQTLLNRGAVMIPPSGPEALIYGAKIFSGGMIADLGPSSFSPTWLPFDSITAAGPHEMRLTWEKTGYRIRAHDAEGESVHSLLWKRRQDFLGQGDNARAYRQQLEAFAEVTARRLREGAFALKIWDTTPPRILLGSVWFSVRLGVTCTTEAVANLIRPGITVQGRRIYPRAGVEFFDQLPGNLPAPYEAVFVGMFEAKKQEGTAC